MHNKFGQDEDNISRLEKEKQALILRENKHRHISRIYRCLREISRFALTELDHKIFIQKACSFLVGQRGYNYAWIALRNADGDFDTAVEAGLGEPFDVIRKQLAAGDLPECCSEALEADKVYVVDDSDKQCPGCPIADLHESYGVMSVRIEYDRRIFGVLTVSVSSDFLDDDETALFGEVASDIGLALNRFEGVEFDRHFKSIIENLPQTFSLISMDYRYLAANELYSKVFGLPIGQILGRRVADLFPQNEWNTRIKPSLDQCSKGNAVNYELEIMTPEFGPRFVQLHYYPYLADPESGEVSGIISHGIDLTDQKQMEERLESSEKRFRYLIETASDTIMILNGDGYITDINESACRIIGKDKEQLLGRPITVVDPNYNPEDFRNFWKRIPPDRNTTFESSHVRFDGTMFPVEISGRRIRLDGKDYILSIARDISERRRDRERLLNALEKAREADRLKSAFLANMSHEIRTPLNGILGFSSLMNDPEITPEKQQQYFSIIQQSGQRLLTTINDLIDISRIEAGMVETWITEINPEELLDELHSFFKPELDLKGVEFIRENSGSKRCPVIYSDRDKLYAILVNLIKNSVKFTDEGFIRIGYHCADGKIEFHVRDSGIGIPADKLDTVFDRFIQADQSLTKPYEGSGLGLSISREYAELLGGSLRAESEFGKGAGFYLRLPIAGGNSSENN